MHWCTIYFYGCEYPFSYKSAVLVALPSLHIKTSEGPPQWKFCIPDRHGWGAFEHPGARRLSERVDRPRASGTGTEVGMSRREIVNHAAGAQVLSTTCEPETRNRDDGLQKEIRYD